VIALVIISSSRPVLGFDFNIAFERTVAILVISCPCALGLATPTSILVGNGKAAQNHILYKGGEFFELANKIQAIAFDKTGTLTIGKPVVTDFTGNSEVLDIVYSIEKESTHPISQAVKEYGESLKANSLVVSDFLVLEGKGIKATVNNKSIYIGSVKILEDLNIDYSKYDLEYNRLLNEAKTTNFVVIDNSIEAM
jgi:Cu+-exporting ATPase